MGVVVVGLGCIVGLDISSWERVIGVGIGIDYVYTNRFFLAKDGVGIIEE